MLRRRRRNDDLADHQPPATDVDVAPGGLDDQLPKPARVGLVGCVKAKQEAAAPARDLYISTLFSGRRRFVERSCDHWFILSALHGVVEPANVVVPYDVTLTTMSSAQRRAWSASVLRQLEQRLGGLSGMTFEVHAGAAYRDFGLVDGLQQQGAMVEVPAAGLRQGEQLAFYKREDR